MQHKILIIDDENDILLLLKDLFEMEGYLVYTACSSEEAFQSINVNPDIILLDINIPNVDGIEICDKIRNFVNCPIIFLTARIEEIDIIRGFNVGGDDYIKKPFSIDELNARVKAHLRRENRKNIKSSIRFSKEIVINYSDRNVFYKDTQIDFTKTEFNIIEILSINKGQVFTKENIYEKLWGFDKDGNSSIIVEHIRRIRTKFSKYTNDMLIETVWGVGYKWIG